MWAGGAHTAGATLCGPPGRGGGALRGLLAPRPVPVRLEAGGRVRLRCDLQRAPRKAAHHSLRAHLAAK